MTTSMQETTETYVGMDAFGPVWVPAYTRSKQGCLVHHGLLISDDTATRAGTLADVLVPGMSAGHEMVMIAAAAPGAIPPVLEPFLTRYARDDADGWQQIIHLAWWITKCRSIRQAAVDSIGWSGPSPTDPLITLVLDDAAIIHEGLDEEATWMITQIAETGSAQGVRLIQGLSAPDDLVSDFWQEQIRWTISQVEPYATCGTSGFIAVTVGAHPVTLDARVLRPDHDATASALAGVARPQLHPLDAAESWHLWEQSAPWTTGRKDPDPFAVGGPRGLTVPAGLRPWAVDWPGYAPVDITKPYLQLTGTLAESVAAGWAEPAIDPTHVDLGARQREALVPWAIVYGRPRNPAGRTGRTGRDLGRWAENPAADPIVVAGEPGDWHLLLIRRDDCGDWAIPGGMVEPGETAPAALVRELLEETGVDLRDLEPQILDRCYIDDPRNTDEAWVASTVALFRVPARIPATGADDALEAAWWPFTGIDQLQQVLHTAGGRLYEAHVGLLATAAYVLHRDTSIHGAEAFAEPLPPRPGLYGPSHHSPDTMEVPR